MLSFEQFDVKTGKTLTDFNEDGTQTPRVIEIEGAYLETWMEANKVEPKGLYAANYYKGVNDGDRSRREKDGKFLICTSGKTGYFADEKTAKLIAEGDVDRGINPIYDNSNRAAHNAVAYGSLPVSDGQAVVRIESKAKVLIIDNEKRSFGSEPLVDRDGKAIPPAEVEDLLDKMGDGTMLIAVPIARELLVEREILKCIDRGLKKELEPEPDDELGMLGDWIDEAFEVPSDLSQSLLAEFKANGKIQPLQVSGDVARSINRNIDKLATETVTQFRVATPDLPGIAKGTAGTSKWCERLGVDAIISTDDIKGDDGRLKQLGMQTFDRGLWMNRKGVAQWTTQAVGMQVKGTIPEATLNELNPIVEAKAQALAEMATSSWEVAARYVAKEDRKQARSLAIVQEEIDGSTEILLPKENSNHTILKADIYNQLLQEPGIAKALEKSVQRDRVDVATSGLEVPAATAQHHSKLEEWEMCDRHLPHGAISVMYRSPVSNVGVFVAVVNNHDAIKEGDPEAYDKRGVIYMNPTTAKKLAVTDFDGDRMGIFVGGIDAELPAKLRAQLAQDPAVGIARHELGRAALAEAIRVVPAVEFTKTVTELIDANAPDLKPMTIAKAPKSDHPWKEGESRTAATWRAWEVTSENPTGKVANLSMCLAGLAAETQYIADAKKPQLLQQIGAKYAEIDPEIVPSDEYLANLGLPKLDLQARIDRIVAAGAAVGEMPQAERLEFAKTELQFVRETIENYADSAVAQNLQTAVDVQKSSVGIDEGIHAAGKALQHKKHELRLDIRKKDVYLDRPLKNNVADPVGFLVDTANALYESSKGLAIEDQKVLVRMKGIVPAIHTAADTKIVKGFIDRYDRAIKPIQAIKARLNVDEIAAEDLQPTIVITSDSGRSLVLQRTIDADSIGDSPIWDEIEGKSSQDFYIAKAPERAAEDYAVYLKKSDGFQVVGYVTPESAENNSLDEFKIPSIEGGEKLSAFKQPEIKFYPPFVMQHEKDRLHYIADRVREEFVVAAGDRKPEFAAAAWHAKGEQGKNEGRAEGMRMAMRQFPEIIASHLDKVPLAIATDLTEVGQNLQDGATIALRYERDFKVSQIAKDGSAQEIGSLRFDSNVPIAPGTVVEARINKDVRKGNKIEIETEAGVAIVKPSKKGIVDGVIPKMSGTFSFDGRRDPTGMEADVYLEDKGNRIYIGVMECKGNSQTAKGNLAVKAKLGELATLNGTMAREVAAEQMQIEVIGKIANHSVAAMDRGELIALPDDYEVPGSEVGSVEVRSPTLGELRSLYQEKVNAGDLEGGAAVAALGKTLIETHQQPWTVPSSYRHPTVTIPVEAPEISVDFGYTPTISELRQLYIIESKADRVEGKARVEALGISLASKYAGEGRVPDNFSDPLVTITAEDREKLLQVEGARNLDEATRQTEMVR